MNDPYSILGVARDATDEQVKAAYKAQARKYHPDNYADNPLSDLAAEKMKEINEAYDAIMDERRSKSKGNSSGGYSYGYGYGGSANSGGSSFPEVRKLINSGRLEEAQEVLDGVPPGSRDAEWYFLNGTVQFRRGWFDNAYSSFSTACRMDPNNMEYRQALNNAQRQAGRQYNPYNTGHYGGGCSTCDMCQGLICADCCCECLGGDLISCC